MVLYQGLRWDHLPWPCSLTCWHPSGSHAAITWGWPQHMFVYPGIKWVCGDFTGSALHYPALKFRYPESSHKGTADGVGLAPNFVQWQQLPWSWTPSGTPDMGNLWGSTLVLTVSLHSARDFCIPKSFMVQESGVGTRVWVPRFLGTWISVLSCSAVL